MTASNPRAGNVHGLLLYDHPSSPCARRVRISLVEKGLTFDVRTIDLSRLEQKRPEYLALNPNGVVPTLVHGDRIVHESNVITRYLDDVFGEPLLYPENLLDLVAVQRWQATELAMAKDYRPLMYQRVLGPLVRLTRTLDEALDVARRSTNDAADLAWEERVWKLEVATADEERILVDRLECWLERLEAALDGRRWLVGDRFGQAEISVYPRVMMFPFVGVAIDPRRLPNLSRWMRALAARPSFAKTLSFEDRALVRLARSGVVGWLARTLRRPPAEHTILQRAGLTALRKIVGRALRDAAHATPAARPSPIGPHRAGRIPPGDAPIRIGRIALPAAASEPIVLFDSRHSPHGRRLRIQLALAGIGFERREIDLARLEHKTPEYLAIHPDGEVPALVHGAFTLVDSATIAEYLDLRFPGVPPLLPRCAFEAARVRSWIALEAGSHREFRPLFWLRVLRPEMLERGFDATRLEGWVAPGVDPSHVTALRETLEGRPGFDTAPGLAESVIRKKLSLLEARLSDAGFLVGDALSLADLAWWTRIDLLPQLGVPIETGGFPAIARWHARLASLPAFSV